MADGDQNVVKNRVYSIHSYLMGMGYAKKAPNKIKLQSLSR